jgi:hypothetical protein
MFSPSLKRITMDYYRQGEILAYHQCDVSGTSVKCDYLYCNYVDDFPCVEDAFQAAELHELSLSVRF